MIEAAQRDPRDFAQLYENNFDRVYAYIASRTRDRAEAEDLTSEVFHQALAKLGHFEWRGLPFKAWLLRIAANALHDRWRNPAKHREIAGESLPEAASEDGIERRALLVQLLDRLPDDQRTVITRRFVYGRSIAEIAGEMGRSEGSVKQLQFRALQTLRNHLRSRHV